jgi:phosphoribosylformylglycinamidine (FGAM) synthase PurS component
MISTWNKHLDSNKKESRGETDDKKIHRIDGSKSTTVRFGNFFKLKVLPDKKKDDNTKDEIISLIVNQIVDNTIIEPSRIRKIWHIPSAIKKKIVDRTKRSDARISR